MVRDWLGMGRCGGSSGGGGGGVSRKLNVSNNIGRSPCIYIGWRSNGRYVTGKVKVNRAEVDCA